MNELETLALQNRRVEFIVDDVSNILYEDKTSESWILEEKDVGILCIAGSLDEAISCIEDNAFGSEIQVIK